MREALGRLKATFNDRVSETVPSEQIQRLAAVCYVVCDAIPNEGRQDIFKGITTSLSLDNPGANGEKILEKLGILELKEFPNHGNALARSLVDGLIRAHESGFTARFKAPIKDAIDWLMNWRSR